MSGAPPLTVRWEPSEEDRLAAVEHADRAWRPVRAAAAALVAFGVAVAALPHPVLPWMWPLVLGGSLVVGLAGWDLMRVRGRRAVFGAHRFQLQVGEEGVELLRDDVSYRLAPSAIRRMLVGSDHVFLHLLDEIVTVPCRTLDEPGALDRFVLALETYRRAGRAPTDVVPEGYTAWELHVAVPRRVHGELRPLIRRGDVHLGFGPAGGWVRGHLGVVRFQWSAVRRIDVDLDGSRLTVADRVLPIVRSAFADTDQEEQFLVDIDRWWVVARPSAPLPSRPVWVDEPNNPYAAPR